MSGQGEEEFLQLGLIHFTIGFEHALSKSAGNDRESGAVQSAGYRSKLRHQFAALPAFFEHPDDTAELAVGASKPSKRRSRGLFIELHGASSPRLHCIPPAVFRRMVPAQPSTSDVRHADAMTVPFQASAGPSLGVEWEIALVDRVSQDLSNRADDVLNLVPPQAVGSAIHRELLRNTVELVTPVCHTVAEAMSHLADSMRVLGAAADDIGLDLLSAGMHPFAMAEQQSVTVAPRYDTLIDRTRFWGQQMVIYGVHVHVGMTNRERVMPVLDSMLRFFPHLQALSASSPYWEATDTGYASNRALLFQQLPTAGLPFQFSTWAEFEAYVTDLTVTGVIDEINEIRWDIRPSPRLGTIEVRVCDAMPTFDCVAATTALTHCLLVDLDARLASGEALPTLPPWHVQENKWRAARYGMEAIIITGADNSERLVTEDLIELLDRLSPVATRLGCAAELAGIETIIERGASYQRQRRVAEASGGDLREVVAALTGELRESLQAQR